MILLFECARLPVCRLYFLDHFDQQLGTSDLPMLTIVRRDHDDDMLAVNDEPGVRSCERGGKLEKELGILIEEDL